MLAVKNQVWRTAARRRPEVRRELHRRCEGHCERRVVVERLLAADPVRAPVVPALGAVRHAHRVAGVVRRFRAADERAMRLELVRAQGGLVTYALGFVVVLRALAIRVLNIHKHPAQCVAVLVELCRCAAGGNMKVVQFGILNA